MTAGPGPSTPRQRAVLDHVAAMVGGAGAGRPLLVAVDGVDGSGKTVFADALGRVLAEQGRPVVRSSIDGFHHPRARRHARGRTSPEGFFLDSYDLEAFQDAVVRPVASGGSRLVRTAAFDHRADRAVAVEPVRVPEDGVVVVDGIFLHRDELYRSWDVSVLLQVTFEETFRRMAVRDGSPPDPQDPANRRYLEGQRLYLASCAPYARASVVVDNEDVRLPRVVDRV